MSSIGLVFLRLGFVIRRVSCEDRDWVSVSTQGFVFRQRVCGEMQTAKEAREARRKRILERGSDRLAYITGDTSKQQSIRSSPIFPAQEASSVADSPNTGGSTRTFESEGATPESSDDVIERVGNSQGSPVSGLQPSYLAGLSAEPSETTAVPASSSRSFIETTTTVPVVASTSSQRRSVWGQKSCTTYVKNVVYSIDASEGLRALAAAVAAVFVVSQTMLSCCGHPWGNVLAVVLPRWPIGLVFLTELTSIIGAYIIHTHSKSPQGGLGSTESEVLDGSVDKISQALHVVGRFEDLLDIGSLCKKAAGAISLDCSIYVVTLVCGFSVRQYVFSCCKGF